MLQEAMRDAHQQACPMTCSAARQEESSVVQRIIEGCRKSGIYDRSEGQATVGVKITCALTISCAAHHIRQAGHTTEWLGGNDIVSSLRA
jgi:hypothetical protein